MQTTYQRDFDVATPGLITDLTAYTSVTRKACGNIPFGVGIVEAHQDSNHWYQTVRLPQRGDGPHLFRGIAIRSHTVEQDDNGDALYPDGYATSILTRGIIWGIAGSCAVAGTDVHIAVSPNEDEPEWLPGRFVRGAGPDLSMPITEVARAAFLTNANAGELVKVSIDYVNQPSSPTPDVSVKKGRKS